MNQQMSETAIRKTITVNCRADDAFRVFTEQIGSWWPFEKIHSVSQAEVETVILEGREGGRFYERTKSGQEHAWGTVLAWDPPRRVACTWHPGRGEETAQELEVTFTPDGDRTRVDLTHTGWERLGDDMADAVGSYESGWETVLGHYVAAANEGR